MRDRQVHRSRKEGPPFSNGWRLGVARAWTRPDQHSNTVVRTTAHEVGVRTFRGGTTVIRCMAQPGTVQLTHTHSGPEGTSDGVTTAQVRSMVTPKGKESTWSDVPAALGLSATKVAETAQCSCQGDFAGSDASCTNTTLAPSEPTASWTR